MFTWWMQIECMLVMSNNKMQWIDLDHQQSKAIKELRLIPKDSKGGSKLPHNPDMRAKRSHKRGWICVDSFFLYHHFD